MNNRVTKIYHPDSTFKIPGVGQELYRLQRGLPIIIRGQLHKPVHFETRGKSVVVQFEPLGIGHAK